MLVSPPSLRSSRPADKASPLPRAVGPTTLPLLQRVLSRLGRLRVTTNPDGHVSIRTTNVSVFSLDSSVWVAGEIKKAMILAIDGSDISIDLGDRDNAILFVRGGNDAMFQRKTSSGWKVLPHTNPLETITRRFHAPLQRIQSVLSTHASLTLLVPSLVPSAELSAALRIAHALYLFHALDAQIVSVTEIETAPAPTSIHEGNLVVIGCAEAPLVQQWLERAGGLWKYVDGAWHLGAERLERPSSGELFSTALAAILFCQPHPYDPQGVALFLQSTDTSGLERAVRLFPIRTGVLSPDWIVVDGRADTIGAAGVQGAGVYGWTLSDDHTTGKWVWNERMSWLD